MKKIIIIWTVVLLSLTAFTSSAFSQSYKQSIGLRVGYWPSISYKLNLSQKNFVNVSCNFGFKDKITPMVSGFYEWQWNVSDIDGLTWYAGPGVYLGTYYYNDNNYDGIHGYMSINVMVGIEYKFPEIPLAISMDYTPGFSLTHQADASYGGGLCIKYCF
ncbi:MAG: hypothetical protein WC140_00925 [Bacteroidales bacterium]